jgi:hypothetical protein
MLARLFVELHGSARPHGTNSFGHRPDSHSIRFILANTVHVASENGSIPRGHNRMDEGGEVGCGFLTVTKVTIERGFNRLNVVNFIISHGKFLSQYSHD